MAYAQTNTWGVPASVTKEVMFNGIDGLDAQPQLVEEQAFNQSWIAPAELGEQQLVSMDLEAQLRYGGLEDWFAMALGHLGVVPTVVSSAGTNSLVAYTRTFTPQNAPTSAWMTLAADESQYIAEMPSLRVKGFSIKTGDQGRMTVTFSVVGVKVAYDSTTNTNSTVAGAVATNPYPMVNRVFRRQGTWRMNPASAAALGASDVVSIVREASFNFSRVLTDNDNVFGLDYSLDPLDDNFPDALDVELTYARMTTISANSLVVGLTAAQVWKADFDFLGSQINSSAAATKNEFKMEFGALQLRTVKVSVAGPGVVRPVATFRAYRTTTPNSVVGMNSLSAPFRITIVSANSTNL